MSRDLVLVTGCARSGTSMVAGVLEACGLDLGGPLTPPSKWNPHGNKEHLAVRQKVLKPLLRELGCDPRGQRKLPPRDVMVPPARVVRLRRAIGVRLGDAWGYKDAKVLLLWPIFHRAFPNARWVLVRRDARAIVDSCLRTDFMKKRKYKAGWVDWVRAHELRMGDLRASGANVVEVWPDPHDPESFRGAVEHAGLSFDAGSVNAALVPSAWHTR